MVLESEKQVLAGGNGGSKPKSVPGSQLTEPDIQKLRAEIIGRVITPRDAEYDSARTVAAGGINRHPAVIVRAANGSDVAAVIALARKTGMELAVRSGGHSAAGHSVTEGGIVLDLKDMKNLDIDVQNRTAWAEAGLTAGEYTAAAAAHGLATGFGDTASVGIGGITLGGGVGYLSRKFGLTIDHLLAAEVATADGRILLADEKSNAELFWAIRGGGGNFGVVTRFHFRLNPVVPFTGGMLFLAATAKNIAAFVKLAQEAPDELSCIINIMPAMPMPFLPPEVHGKLVIMAEMAFTGPDDAGEKVLAPFRQIDKPIIDLVRPMNYLEMYPHEEGEFHPTLAFHNLYVDHIDTREAAIIVDSLEKSDAAVRVAQIRVLGGAIARVPEESTAYAHRKSHIMVHLVAFYNGPDDRPAKETWVKNLAGDLFQGDPAVYVNFLGDEGQERVRAAYPGSTWERLAAIKAQYDPDNLFRLNQNVIPRR